jgi:hypothetical protein
MTGQQPAPWIRQAFFGFFRWVLPILVVFLLILLPSWTTRPLLWNSWVADWFARIFLTIAFVSWHRTHARIFVQPDRAIDVSGEPQPPKQVAVINGVILGLIITSQVLAGIIGIGFFTWFAIVTFVPALEPWAIVISIAHICLVILPWLSYRKIDLRREQSPGSPAK